MEWHPAGWSVCLPMLIFPCTIKSRSSLLALAHPGGPGKTAVKWLWCGVVIPSYLQMKCGTGILREGIKGTTLHFSGDLFLFWHAPLGVRNTIRRHQPPQRTVVSQVDCFVQCEVVGCQVSLDGVQPRDTRMPWSPQWSKIQVSKV